MSAMVVRRVLAMAGAMLVVAIACRQDRGAERASRGDSAVRVALPADVHPAPKLPSRFATFGRVASDAEVSAWNIDANPAGSGLPPGRGTYAAGATIFAQKCAACHGARGEGIGPYPRLVGREPRTGFPFGQDPALVKTVGNYWPYATTLYDYVHRAMPLTKPGSLRPDEVYSLVAFLLAENQVIGKDAVIDARTLPRIAMPARGHFVRDDRTASATFR